MAGIKDYSTTAANNNAAVPNGWPEGQAPATLNNCARQNMADLRSWYEDAQWVNLGHSCTRTTSTTFTIGADVTSTYTAGRAIRIVDSSTLYDTIVSSSYGSSVTTVTVATGGLTATMNGQNVTLGTMTPTNNSVARTLVYEQTALASITGSDALLIADSRSSGLVNQNKKVTVATLRSDLLANITGEITATGALNVAGTSSTAGSLVLYEDTDNGTNYFKLIAPASIASDVTLTAPSALPSVNDSVWVSSTTGATEFKSMQTLLNTTGTAPVYGVRAWVNFNGTGTVAIRTGGNVSSITDGGLGRYTVNTTVALPTANFAASVLLNDYLSRVISARIVSQTTSALTIDTWYGDAAGADFSIVHVMIVA